MNVRVISISKNFFRIFKIFFHYLSLAIRSLYISTHPSLWLCVGSSCRVKYHRVAHWGYVKKSFPEPGDSVYSSYTHHAYYYFFISFSPVSTFLYIICSSVFRFFNWILKLRRVVIATKSTWVLNSIWDLQTSDFLRLPASKDNILE